MCDTTVIAVPVCNKKCWGGGGGGREGGFASQFDQIDVGRSIRAASTASFRPPGELTEREICSIAGCFWRKVVERSRDLKRKENGGEGGGGGWGT